MKLDILAFGAHPDDVELGAGGTLIKHVQAGKKCGIVDLTRGELGTRGSAETRMIEANNAAEILGLSAREQMNFRDGFIKNDEEHQLRVIEMLRKYQPEIVLTNAPSDRHPDHGNACNLLKDACFLSGLRRIETSLAGEIQEAWRPRAVYHYVQFLPLEPSFAVDVTAQFDKKMEAVLAYKSQFYNPDSKEPETYISTPQFQEFLKARYLTYGKLIGVQYAEGFIASRLIGVDSLDHLI